MAFARTALFVMLLFGWGIALAARVSGGDEAALGKVIERQALAWNAGDGAAWGADYSADADFVNILGTVFQGRPEIVARHAAIFAGPFQGSRLTITARSEKLLSPTVALVETNQEVTGFRGLPPGIAATSAGVLRTHMKYVLTKLDGQWRIVAAQNTAVLPAGAKP